MDDFSSDVFTTGVLPLGVAVDGSLEVAGDEDWFKATLQRFHDYRINFSSPDGTLSRENNRIAEFTLFDSTGRQVGNTQSAVDDSSDILTTHDFGPYLRMGTIDCNWRPSTQFLTPSIQKMPFGSLTSTDRARALTQNRIWTTCSTGFLPGKPTRLKSLARTPGMGLWPIRIYEFIC